MTQILRYIFISDYKIFQLSTYLSISKLAISTSKNHQIYFINLHLILRIPLLGDIAHCQQDHQSKRYFRSLSEVI